MFINSSKSEVVSLQGIKRHSSWKDGDVLYGHFKKIVKDHLVAKDKKTNEETRRDVLLLNVLAYNLTKMKDGEAHTYKKTPDQVDEPVIMQVYGGMLWNDEIERIEAKVAERPNWKEDGDILHIEVGASVKSIGSSKTVVVFSTQAYWESSDEQNADIDDSETPESDVIESEDESKKDEHEPENHAAEVEEKAEEKAEAPEAPAPKAKAKQKSKKAQPKKVEPKKESSPVVTDDDDDDELPF